MYNEISISDIVNLYLLQPITQTFQNAKHRNELKGSMKEPNISIYFFFFCPSLNGVLFPMFCLLVEGQCQILLF